MKRFAPLVLVVEDDESIALLIQIYLEKEGFEVKFATNGEEALAMFQNLLPQLVILDIMIPKLDGVKVCKKIRQQSDVPLIMVTAKSQTHDKIVGLEAGADDYISKPFDPPELVARVKAVLRRSQTRVPQQIHYDHLTIDLRTYVVKVGDTTYLLPPKEMELLYFLASHPNQVFTREQILNQVWGAEYEGDDRTVDVHIKRIREKLEKHSGPWRIRTVWGVGYKFEVQNP
jgi:two-component system, OmpR family, response regulator